MAKLSDRSRKQQFYEEAYPEKREDVQLRSWIGFLYSAFRGYEIHRETVVKQLLPHGGVLLDIGSGDGDMVLSLRSSYSHVYGIDIAKTRIRKANEKKRVLTDKEKKTISFLYADADMPLPFDDDSIDVVTMVATLEHFFDPYQIISEVYRVLRPGGTVIFQVPNLGFLPRRIAVCFGYLPVTSEDDTGWDGGHLHYFTVSSVEEFLSKMNFSCDRVTCSGVFASLRRWWVSLLGADIIVRAYKS